MMFDVVILTILPEEEEAVREIFGLREKIDTNDPVTYARWEGIINYLRVGLVRVSDKGQATVASIVPRIIEHWNPNYILVVGIGGGLQDQVKLGDVVYSKRIEFYEREHKEAGKSELRKTTVSQPFRGLRDIAYATSSTEFKFNVHEGVVISTELVINDPSDERLKKMIENNEGEVLVFEIEGGGVARAIYDELNKEKRPEFLIIRGISDFVNDPKGKKVRVEQKKNAARNAAIFAYELVKRLGSGKSSELGKYLEHVKSYFKEKSKIDGKSLKDYYVKPEMRVCDIESWNKPEESIWWKDDVIEEWDVREFLEGDELYIVIGAPFGAGKTSYLKYLAYTLAEEGEYIPVYVQLRGCKSIYDADVYKGRDLRYVLEIAPKSRIVLLVDSLDEFAGEPRDAIREIKELNVKAIIATRLKAGYPEDLRINKYVRIFRFWRNQIGEFFKKYGVNASYDDVVALGIEDLLGKPLFCWMLAVAWNALRNIKLKEEWRVESRRAIIYYIFTREIIRGKYLRSKEVGDFITYYEQEKEFLRIAAALANIHTPLKYDELIKGIKEISPELGEIVEREKERFGNPVLTSYFLISPRIEGKIVEFIHKSFKEYFLAEYYYKNIRDGRKELMYTGMPSEETIDFLKGLAEISRNKEILRLLEGLWCEDFKNEVLNFFDYEMLKKNAKSFVESDDLVLFLDKIHGTERFKVIKDVDLAYVWLYRWISLCVLSGKDKRSIKGEKIAELIKSTSHVIPYYLKQLNGVDLNRVDLRGVDLSGADLRWAKLIEANLSRADLREANLSEANLTEANLSLANLSWAKLNMASLNGADLIKTNLFRADLSRVDLTRANLSYADLNKANLNEADLTEVNLSGVNLRWAKLVKVNAYNIYFYKKPITKYIILGSYEKEISETLEKIDPRLREVILKDNPYLREYWKRYNFIF